MELFSFSSNSTIILKAYETFEYKGKTYNKDEIIYVGKCSAYIDFNNRTSTAIAGATLNNKVFSYPSSIVLTELNRNNMLMELITDKVQSQKEIFYTKSVTTDENGIAYIDDDIKSNYMILKNGVKDINASVDIANGNLNGEANTEYVVVYYKDTNINEYYFTYQDLPYLTLEMKTVGNIDNENGYNIFIAERVSIKSVSNINLTKDVGNVDITLNVISTNSSTANKEIHNYYSV